MGNGHNLCLTSVNSKFEMCSGAPVRGINIVIIASMTSTITLNHKLLALKLRIEYYRRLSRGKGGGRGRGRGMQGGRTRSHRGIPPTLCTYLSRSDYASIAYLHGWKGRGCRSFLLKPSVPCSIFTNLRLLRCGMLSWKLCPLPIT